MYDLLLGLDPLAVFGLLSAALSAFAFLPYLRDTLRGTTHPQRAAWLIWSILGSIAFSSQVFEGASHSLWFAGAQVGGTILVFLLSIPCGAGGFLSARDRWILLLAAAGLVVWYFTDTSVYALAITISISSLGGIVTVAKAYRAPSSETLSTWVLSFLASICAILAVGPLDWVLLAYPLYLLALNGAIVVAVLLGRTQDRHSIKLRLQAIPA